MKKTWLYLWHNMNSSYFLPFLFLNFIRKNKWRIGHLENYGLRLFVSGGSMSDTSRRERVHACNRWHLVSDMHSVQHKCSGWCSMIGKDFLANCGNIVWWSKNLTFTSRNIALFSHSFESGGTQRELWAMATALSTLVHGWNLLFIRPIEPSKFKQHKGQLILH